MKREYTLSEVYANEIKRLEKREKEINDRLKHDAWHEWYSFSNALLQRMREGKSVTAEDLKKEKRLKKQYKDADKQDPVKRTEELIRVQALMDKLHYRLLVECKSEKIPIPIVWEKNKQGGENERT